MTSKEALENIKSRINSLSLFPKVDRKTYDESWEKIEKDLDLLDLYKKFFKYSLTEIEWIKYLVLPNNSDIRRPDTMLKITDEEYEILKEGLEK